MRLNLIEHSVKVGRAVSEEIEQACLFGGAWSDVVNSIGSAFPGVFVMLVNVDIRQNQLTYLASHGVEQPFLNSFAHHFAFVNPWNPIWASMGNDGILVSEDMAPASLFSETELYQDWLRPQHDFDAGVGMRLNVGGDRLIYLAIHYDPRQHSAYGRSLVRLYETIRRPMKQALDLAHAQISNSQSDIARGAISQRFGQCAIVISSDKRIRDVNDYALRAFEGGSGLFNNRGRLAFRDQKADRELSGAIWRLLNDDSQAAESFCFAWAERSWLVNLTPLTIPLRNGLGSLFSPERLILVLVQDIHGRGDLSDQFARSFGLTGAEKKLCFMLGQGNTVRQAAEALQISEGTARQRTKSVLAKTNTSRQAELMRLMTRFMQ